MLLRKESAHTVLVLLHNPTARCHDVHKEYAEVGGGRNAFPNNAIEQNPVNRWFAVFGLRALRRATVIGVRCENCVKGNYYCYCCCCCCCCCCYYYYYYYYYKEAYVRKYETRAVRVNQHSACRTVCNTRLHSTTAQPTPKASRQDFFPPKCHHMFLWTFVVSLLVVAIV